MLEASDHGSREHVGDRHLLTKRLPPARPTAAPEKPARACGARRQGGEFEEGEPVRLSQRRFGSRQRYAQSPDRVIWRATEECLSRCWMVRPE
jgi:hypothetical protein